DKQWMEFIRNQSADVLGDLEIQRDDIRLAEMLFRYQARNYPETLSGEEAERREQYRYNRLTDPNGGGSIVLQDYFRQIEELMQKPDLTARDRGILQDLYFYGESVIPVAY